MNLIEFSFDFFLNEIHFKLLYYQIEH